MLEGVYYTTYSVGAPLQVYSEEKSGIWGASWPPNRQWTNGYKGGIGRASTKSKVSCPGHSSAGPTSKLYHNDRRGL